MQHRSGQQPNRLGATSPRPGSCIGIDGAIANLCTAVALLTWVMSDMLASAQRKLTFLGAINGMTVGLVGIAPAAGFVNSFAAMITGVVSSSLVWMSWNWLGRTAPFKKVDDALRVIHTHGIAGWCGGLMTGQREFTSRVLLGGARTGV